MKRRFGIGVIKQGQLYFISSFLLLIAGGTLLLKLPFCYRAEYGTLPWVDALFTATSSVCVTGLLSTPASQFTLAGQLVILLLIQLGGLGVMTLTAAIVIWLGRGMSAGNTMMMSSLSDKFSLRRTEGLLKTVLTYTIAIELVGALVLSVGFLCDGRFGVPESLYYGLFFAVSSFCNAGIVPINTSVAGLSGTIKIMVALLVILGGIGIYVIYDLANYRNRQAMLRIHTRIVLAATVVLLAAGTLGLWSFERIGHGENLSWLDAFFMSASARTAGFTSIDVSALDKNSNALLIILMMIGTSPGSTGGGIKTPVVALAFLAVWNTIKGNSRILMGHREIPISVIMKAFTIIIIFIVMLTLGSSVLALTTTGSLQSAIFETASALSTTGLSMGSTELLAFPAKCVLICYMFAGRIGPFTILLFLMGREKVDRIGYPEERIIIG